MKNLTIVLLIALVASILLNFNTCNELDTSQSVSKSEIEQSKKTVLSLKSDIANLNDSINNNQSRVDTIIQYRNVDRANSSKKIAAVTALNVYASDSIWDSRYSSKKESLISDAKCDSLKLEYRSITELYRESLNKSSFLTESNFKKDTIINELEFQNQAYQLNLEHSEKKLKRQRLRKWGYLIIGIAGGFIYSEVRNEK